MPVSALVLAALVATAPDGLADDAIGAEPGTETSAAEPSFWERGEHRLHFELVVGGSSLAPVALRQPTDVLWSKTPLSAWWGGRFSLQRTESFGVTWGGEVDAAFNREDDGNAVVGEIRSRGRLGTRALAGYRLELLGTALTPYGLAGLRGDLGVRQLGVLDDSKVTPLLGAATFVGTGLQLEIWRVSVRFEGGLSLGLHGPGSFGAASLGFVL